MYAVIASGGKQEKVNEGQVLRVERLSGAEAGNVVQLRPVLLIDGATVIAGDKLSGAKVEAKVVGEVKGPKIRGFNYKNKSRQTKRWGHRQKYTQVEITSIQADSGK
jgi:large subunit ribosomal protein L21